VTADVVLKSRLEDGSTYRVFVFDDTDQSTLSDAFRDAESDIGIQPPSWRFVVSGTIKNVSVKEARPLRALLCAVRNTSLCSNGRWRAALCRCRWASRCSCDQWSTSASPRR
jgi:hypothetical protein